MISAKHTAQGLAQRKSSQVGPGLYWLFQRRQTWQVNTVANVEAQSPSLFSYFLVFSLLSLSDALTVAWSLPTPTQSPTVCPSTSSVLSFPPNVVVHLSVGLSHLTQCLTENIPCMTPSPKHNLLQWCTMLFITDLAGCISQTNSQPLTLLLLPQSEVETSGNQFNKVADRQLVPGASQGDSREPLRLG